MQIDVIKIQQMVFERTPFATNKKQLIFIINESYIKGWYIDLFFIAKKYVLWYNANSMAYRHLLYNKFHHEPYWKKSTRRHLYE